jgi:hypothetical protein
MMNWFNFSVGSVLLLVSGMAHIVVVFAYRDFSFPLMIMFFAPAGIAFGCYLMQDGFYHKRTRRNRKMATRR